MQFNAVSDGSIAHRGWNVLKYTHEPLQGADCVTPACVEQPDGLLARTGVGQEYGVLPHPARVIDPTLRGSLAGVKQR